MTFAWLPVAVISYLFLSINGTIDRAIVHQEKTKPIVISFWVAIFSVLTFGLIVFGFLPGNAFDGFRLSFENPEIVMLAIIAGAMAQAGLLYMYRALEHGEATRVLSTIGALTPIVSLVGAYLFLDERLETLSIVAFVLLIMATVVLTFEPHRDDSDSHPKWVINAILASLFIGSQSVVIKHVFDNYEFVPGFALTGLGAGIFVLVIAASSKHVRKEIHGLISKVEKPKKKAQTSKQVKWIFANSILGGFAVMLLNFAISLGSPTLVNALRGIQYAGVFIIALLLAKKLPQLLDEDFTPMSILLKTVGIVLIINGVIILAIST